MLSFVPICAFIRQRYRMMGRGDFVLRAVRGSMSRLHFQSLSVSGWRQFDAVDIQFHSRLTILTGANGAGKSSLLRLLSRHFGYDKAFLSTPVFKDGKISFFAGMFLSLRQRFLGNPHRAMVGRLTYSDGTAAEISIPQSQSVQYMVELPDQKTVVGLHVDSHQPPINYAQVSNIPANQGSVADALTQYNQALYSYYSGGYMGGQGPAFKMKEAIIGMAVFGEGNSRNRGRPELTDALNGFVRTLKTVLPPSLGFIDLEVRAPDVVLITSTGEFLLDSVSGGVACLIDMAWRIYLMSLSAPSFVVTMDEPENHLHPSMQRSLLERLLTAFPMAQFIVATHSPFIVSSVKDSSVYVLRYNEEDRPSSDGFLPEGMRSRVVTERLDTVNKSGSANEILREVLGVEATVPNWVLEGVRAVADRYRGRPITKEILNSVRKDLAQLGYDDQFTTVLADLTADS